MSAAPFYVVGFAACTSLGFSVEATLAAMGAGLSNFTDSAVLNRFGEFAIAAQFPGIDVNMDRKGRLEAWARAGLEDLEVLLHPLKPERVPMLVGTAADLQSDEREAVRGVFQGSNSVLLSGSWMYDRGRTSAFAALADAVQMLQSESAKLVVVAGVDSLCAPATVRHLMRSDRLLSQGNEGTIPGEAIAFALLARADHPAATWPTAIRLNGIALHDTGTSFLQREIVHADGLVSVLQALRQTEDRRVDRVIAAHSGEGYFGRSFTHAYLREADFMPEPLVVELTADRLGDVGAAAGILGMALAMYHMAQDDSGHESRALVFSECDVGEAAALIVEGSPASWQRDQH